VIGSDACSLFRRTVASADRCDTCESIKRFDYEVDGVFTAVAGFLWGWAMFWTMHSGIIAAIAVIVAR
jgi:hypothetical protein